MDIQATLAHINKVNDYIKLPADACEEIKKMISIIASDKDFEERLEKITRITFDKLNWGRKGIDEIAEFKCVDKNLLALTVVELFSIETMKLYIRREWPLEVYYDNLLDIGIWAKDCLRKTGKWGLIDYSWVCMSLTGDVVRLGRLQFQLLHTQESILPITIAGVTIKEDDLVINIHIPEGDSISKEKRLDAYRKAYKFFKQTGHAVFMCHSWLLYPRHKEILPVTSNINSFIDDFNIVSSGNNSLGDMWRVFGPAWPPKDNNYDLLPQSTGIQKAYVKELKNGSTLGGGLGFFVFDGENIIS